MPRYASDTTVPVERSRAKIEETLRRYHATEFHSGWTGAYAWVAFKLDNYFIKFELPFPRRDEKRFTRKLVRGKEQKLSELQASRAYEQELRSRWRALLLVVKAKLEAVECQISSIEKEFLAFIVIPGANELTIGDWLKKQVLPQIAAKKAPQLGFKPMGETGEIQDAEFEAKEKPNV